MYILVASTSLLGCARWSARPETEQPQKSMLSTPELTPDSVIVETVVARFPHSNLEDLTAVWLAADETILGIEDRQRLDASGLRVGLLTRLPPIIKQRLDELGEMQSTNILEHAGLAADVDNRMRQLHCRAGRRREVIVRREVQESLIVLNSSVDGTVSGESYEKATTLFDLRANPQGDGSVQLSLVPEIQHGQHHKAFVSTDFGVRPEIKRRHRRWEDLNMEVRLEPHQILMVSSTTPPKAVGRSFFTTVTADKAEETVVLLLRIPDSQLDELFAPEVIEQARAMTER